MLETGVFLRIREGAFTYLLAAEPAASIEHRHDGNFDLVDAAELPLAAWYRAGDSRIPVVRLGRLMQTRVGDWEHAIVLADGAERLGIAAEHVAHVPDAEKPDIQPFNPVGCKLPDGPVVCGVCPGTEPECLVLDTSRLRQSLRRAAQG